MPLWIASYPRETHSNVVLVHPQETLGDESTKAGASSFCDYHIVVAALIVTANSHHSDKKLFPY